MCSPPFYQEHYVLCHQANYTYIIRRMLPGDNPDDDLVGHAYFDIKVKCFCRNIETHTV